MGPGGGVDQTTSHQQTHPDPGARSSGREVSRAFRVLAFALLLLAAGVGVGLWASHPRGWIPPCPTWRFLGVHCPGCGSTRSVHLLLNANPGAALQHNALMILIGLPAGAVYAWGWATIALRGQRPEARVTPRVLVWGIVVVVVAFALVRNIPGAPFDALRPPPPVATH